MTGISPVSYVAVERGFQDNSTRIVLLLLGCVGGILVLGGTLTATFLALSDARPDFATMSAVGAAPRTRRFVAASYAATIGLVGAVLGAAVGFVPGIAITYPLTGTSWLPAGSTGADGSVLPDHFIDIPWLLVGGLVLAAAAADGHHRRPGIALTAADGQPAVLTCFAHASICSTERMPTDS